MQDSQGPRRRDPEDLDGLGPGPGNILFETWLTSRAVHALIDDAIRTSGLDADEFAIYSVLASDDGATPTELARWMAAPPTTVSSYIKRFEARGHVKRTPNPDDRRSHRVRLTAKGRKAHLTAGQLFAPALEAVERTLGAESTQVRNRLGALRRAVAEGPGD